MMDHETQLKLQAHLDGELSEAEAGRIEELLAGDPEAQALLTELKTTSGALVSFEDEVKLPESREFFWSKVQRGIEFQGRQAPQPARRQSTWLAGWRRWLVPAGAVAAATVAALLVVRPEPGPEVETSMADSVGFTYRDFAARTTLVWLSYPAEEDLIDGDAADSME